MKNEKAMNHLKKVLTRELLSLEELASVDEINEIKDFKISEIDNFKGSEITDFKAKVKLTNKGTDSMNKKQFNETLDQTYYELSKVNGLLAANDAIINDLTVCLDETKEFSDYKAAFYILSNIIENSAERLESINHFAKQSINENVDRLGLLNLNYTTDEDVRGAE